MAFYSGNFSSFDSLKTSVESALQANDWTLSNGVLSKSGMFLKLTAGADALLAQAGTGASAGDITGPAPNAVKLFSAPDFPINFPAAYDLHIHAAPDEVFLVINYNADKYQQLSWGKSRVEQVGGTGMWFSGSFTEHEAYGSLVYIGANYSYAGTGYSGQSCGLFFEQSNSPGGSYVHTGLDATSWKGFYGNVTESLTGSGDVVAALLQALPSQFNQNTVLLPLYAVQRRESNGQTIVVDMVNARLCRIDNHLPGEVVTYGGDQWKIYPLHRKSSDVRNGVPWSTGADHSGTFGYAIRYSGP